MKETLKVFLSAWFNQIMQFEHQSKRLKDWLNTHIRCFCLYPIQWLQISITADRLARDELILCGNTAKNAPFGHNWKDFFLLRGKLSRKFTKLKKKNLIFYYHAIISIAWNASNWFCVIALSRFLLCLFKLNYIYVKKMCL